MLPSMAVIVSHAAALEVLRRGARLAPERLNGAPLATSASSRRAAERRDELQALRAFLVEVGLLDVGSQLDILAGPNECRPAVARVRTHRWTTATALPIRQVFLPGTGRVDGLYVVAPELLFVELCAADKVMRKGSAPSPKSMAHVRAALLGWELCGRYGKVLPGDRRDALAARGFENRPPLTSVNDIRSFADAMAPGLAGVRRARGALALVRDGGRRVHPAGRGGVSRRVRAAGSSRELPAEAVREERPALECRVRRAGQLLAAALGRGGGRVRGPWGHDQLETGGSARGARQRARPTGRASGPSDGVRADESGAVPAEREEHCGSTGGSAPA